MSSLDMFADDSASDLPETHHQADDDGVDDTGEVETSVIEEEEGDYLVPVSDLKEVSLEIVEGDKAGSKWLVLEKTYIFHKNTSSVDGSEVFWECAARRKHNCPVRAATVETESGKLELLFMYHSDFHMCNQDGTEVIKQTFKNNVKQILASDHRKQYTQVLGTITVQCTVGQFGVGHMEIFGVFL